ncbi:MAG: ATP-binding protein [Pseudorhodoferax sp.]
MLGALAAKLPQVPADGVRALLHVPPGGPFGAFKVELGWSILTLESGVRLPDGRWLHARQLPLAGYQWWRLLRFSVPTSTLPVLAIVLLCVWRMLRPLKTLADAAERVSRGERIDPLPLVGPRETRELSAAFNLMQEKLTRFIDHRTQMLAAISHDFRTPITSLRLRAELVDEPAQRAAMVRTLDEMRTMVEQTLRFAQDDAALEETRETDLRALLQQIEQEQHALGHDVVLAPGPALPYRARPVSLKRAVANLVDNAVRHGGRARLALAAGQPVRITVDDDGPGLDASLLEQVFEPFFQRDQARNHQGGGVGLGLSIARSCVRAHGGEVALANRPEGGLRATVTLP